MKTLIGALALIVAAPVAAQTAPAADPNTAHPQHEHAPGMAGEHKMDCKCCDKMKEQHGKMDCCDEHAKEHAAHDSHPAQ